ncbi:MAG TPA: BrnA antitoxin family protein [Roseiarcus sp.]|nr:BrnA antitoxin family protein [Roseiarcus sp.]
MQAAGKTGSDWQAAARRPIPDGSDPDDAMEHVAWATTELPMPKRKEHINLRIDADVLAFFRGQGRGYQTKINAVLRSYFEQLTMRRNEEVSPKKAVSHDPGGTAKKAKSAQKIRKVGPHHPARRVG